MTEYKTVKVKPETYRRLRYYQNVMELQAFDRGEEARFSLDDVINAALNLTESAKFKFPKEEKPKP